MIVCIELKICDQTDNILRKQMLKTYKEPVIVQEQMPNSPNYKKMLFGIIGGALLVIILLIVGFLFKHKRFAANNGSYGPYVEQRSSHPKIEVKDIQ